MAGQLEVIDVLTDRQSKFYNRIQLCLLSESEASDEERKYLTIAKNKLDSGMEFKNVINSLNLALSALDYGRLQIGGLTPEVKALFENLKSIYGEPVNQDIYAEKLASVVSRNNGIVQYTRGTIILMPINKQRKVILC
ncbi:bacteriocin immunity protein [Lactovum odontotermitis]